MIKKNIDIKLFYLTATHTLLLLCQKLAQPNILQNYEKDKDSGEIKVLIDSLLAYIKA